MISAWIIITRNPAGQRSGPARFIQRPDLQKYQLLYLSGYGPRVPDGTYRIIRVMHTYGLAVNKTQVQFILDSAFAAKQRLGWTYQDTITEIEVVAAAMKKRELPNEPIEFVADKRDGTWTVKTRKPAGQSLPRTPPHDSRWRYGDTDHNRRK